MSEIPSPIGSTHLWMRALEFDPIPVKDMQSVITRCAEWTGTTVIGAYVPESGALSLLKWPDGRPEYIEPTEGECDSAFYEIRDQLDAYERGSYVRDNEIHSLMGLRVNGYSGCEFKTTDFIKNRTTSLAIGNVVMVSARVKQDGSVEPYTEPAAILIGPPNSEEEIHNIGQTLKQHHYAIERMDQNRTDFYETVWA